MSATCSRVSWVDLCKEDEECVEKWLEPSNAHPVINSAVPNTPAPTPSKQLGDCLNNLHMITPLKDIAAKELSVGPIKFDLDEKSNDPVTSDTIKTTEGNLEESENKNFVIPKTTDENIVVTNEIIDEEHCKTSVNSSEKDKILLARNTEPSLDVPNLQVEMDSRTDENQSIAPSSSGSKFDDSRKRTRRNSASSSATTCDSPRSKKANYELELDPAVLKRRQKQIDFGKNTLGYDCYIKAVPKDKRKKNHPTTPPKHLKYSRRAFDGLVKIWRQELHNWDPKNETDDKNLDSDSESDEPSLDESLLLTD